MDSQALFRDGIQAIREKKDMKEGRKLLTQALRLDPENEMAWLWLSRTVGDLDKQLQCIDRALMINPQNVQAQALRQSIVVKLSPPAPTNGNGAHADGEDDDGKWTLAPEKTPSSRPLPKQKKRLSIAEKAEIKRYLDKAEERVQADDSEGAVEQWVRVLEIAPDHEVALPSAVRHLSRMKYIDDAKELVWDAITSGTDMPSVYMTAMDIARYQKDDYKLNEARERLAFLPTAPLDTLCEIVDYYVNQEQGQQAVDILEHALENHPDDQKLLVRMGDLHKGFGRTKEAKVYYERAARKGTHTSEGKAADQRLLQTAPLLTDKERGSIPLAVREAVSFPLFYLLLGWQDAGLNLAYMGGRWLGVVLSLVGGYLLITATSSPQQAPLGRLLGGRVPRQRNTPERARPEFDEHVVESGPHEDVTALPIIPPTIRAVMGVIGVVILVYAFWLVFNNAVHLLVNPVDPYILPIEELYEMVE